MRFQGQFLLGIERRIILKNNNILIKLKCLTMEGEPLRKVAKMDSYPRRCLTISWIVLTYRQPVRMVLHRGLVMAIVGLRVKIQRKEVKSLHQRMPYA